MIDIGYIKPDIYMITETWLNNDITDLSLTIDGYNLLRSDRDFDSTGKTGGGGVCMFVRHEIVAETFPSLKVTEVSIAESL